MLRATPSLCLFCEVRSVLHPKSSPWLQSRQYASKQLQRRKPARLELSRRVAEAPPKLSSRGKPIQKRTGSPFAAMNRTRVNIRESRPSPPPGSEKRRKPPGRGIERKEKRQDGDFRALKMQRALSNVSYQRRSSIKEEINHIQSFEQFPLLPVVQESISTQALKGMEDAEPTPIQRVAIPALLGTDNVGKRTRKRRDGMEQFLLAAETGSGKTLAYLLPIIDAIKHAEAREAEQAKAEEDNAKRKKEERKAGQLFELDPGEDAFDSSGRPRAIILVPTAELVAQVTTLAKALCHKIKFRVSGISSSISPTVIKSRLFAQASIDMLVSTPHLLASIADAEPRVLSRVSHLVIDEADSLFDRSFAKETTPIIDRSTPTLKQLILCSATIPRSLDNYLRTRFPDIRRLVTPNLHAIPRRVQLGVVEVDKEPYRGNKSLACADTIWTIGKSAAEHGTGPDKENVDTKRIIVFVNERDTAKEVSEYLVSKGIDAIALSRAVDNVEKQAEALADFTGAALPTTSPGPTSVPLSTKGRVARSLPNTKVLVATDLGSRGIDTTAVRHVILYDVPHTTIDFIHRLGRTGRMGRRGRGIVLVGKGDRRDVVKEVREGMFMGKALI
ncbi:ATP-dependent RNA helicase mrh4, mitochondrial [Rhizodiscina lignyota]|uniref:RNA helicase n=1 Tax=Rhizodiscina lignyota TaxID=1504668 RepID=A0A9P4ILR8_9PEZI|nr:ATP-dependent RNA helicase mrh4, mitochondrial [Rhizodiscina lignyota]